MGYCRLKQETLKRIFILNIQLSFPKFTGLYGKNPFQCYETGGIYQYVLMDVENNPTVKLVDLRSAESIRELNLRKNINGRVPFNDSVGENVYAVDFKTMGFKEPLTVPSPYSDAHLADCYWWRWDFLY